tara:strand:+ start:4938 stop:5138 length:201 start_codon:yes stop_codon:yes gene_type:complete
MNDNEKAEKLCRLLEDLIWEYQRMSTDGQTTLNEIYAMVGIEPINDDSVDAEDRIVKMLNNRLDRG